jgi:catechol 2,3-dioxygenase-like lactoylglutathione lyase family enzyme
MVTISIRYIVDDIDAAVRFYCGLLGFEEVMHPALSFAMLEREDLRLVLSAPSGSAGGGQAMPDGTLPEPGGWNRFMLEVSDIVGVGGKQILLEDPSGNLIELFEPTRPEAGLSSS